LLVWAARPAMAQNSPIRPLVNGTVLPANDDGSSDLVALGFDANFFGVTRSALYVNNNGNVTFDRSMSTFVAFPLNTTSQIII
ncbi:hypothetical protein ABTM50_20815, partial [Acinetobacter baumannii]